MRNCEDLQLIRYDLVNNAVRKFAHEIATSATGRGAELGIGQEQISHPLKFGHKVSSQTDPALYRLVIGGALQFRESGRGDDQFHFRFLRT